MLQFDKLARQYPVELWSLLALSKLEQLTSAYVQDLFHTVYSAMDSNNRSGEERAVMLFYDYMQECEVNDVVRSDIICNTATFKADACFDLTDNPESTGITGGDVLAFVTGTNRLLALEFKDTPELMFTDEKRLPPASTCAPSLVLSRYIFI